MDGAPIIMSYCPALTGGAFVIPLELPIQWRLKGAKYFMAKLLSEQNLD